MWTEMDAPIPIRFRRWSPQPLSGEITFCIQNSEISLRLFFFFFLLPATRWCVLYASRFFTIVQYFDRPIFKREKSTKGNHVPLLFSDRMYACVFHGKLPPSKSSSVRVCFWIFHKTLVHASLTCATQIRSKLIATGIHCIFEFIRLRSKNSQTKLEKIKITPHVHIYVCNSTAWLQNKTVTTTAKKLRRLNIFDSLLGFSSIFRGLSTLFRAKSITRRVLRTCTIFMNYYCTYSQKHLSGINGVRIAVGEGRVPYWWHDDVYALQPFSNILFICTQSVSDMKGDLSQLYRRLWSPSS